jgi:hypothetical protein
MEKSEGVLWDAAAFEKLIRYQTYMDDLRAREDVGTELLAA